MRLLTMLCTVLLASTALAQEKKDPAIASGKTRQNKLVHFPVDGPVPAAGTFADVRITGSAAHFLRGELVAITARPRHKTRIPVAAV